MWKACEISKTKGEVIGSLCGEYIKMKRTCDRSRIFPGLSHEAHEDGR